MKYKSLAINIGLFLFSIIIVLAMLEVAIRIFVPGPHQNQQVRIYHPQAGYQFPKNLDTYIDTGSGPFHVITNEYGYIGESYSLEKPNNEFRIANFGDSYIEGIQMVDWNNTLVELIGKKLNEETEQPDFKSINFGIGGRGTVEEFWTYKYIAEQAKPDLNILWFTLANDFANNYLPVTKYAPLAENKMGKVKYFLKKSALVSFLFENLKDNITFISFIQKLGLSNRIVYIGQDEIQYDSVNFDDKVNYSIRPEMKEIQEHAYNVTEELIVNFKNLAEQNNEEFFMVIIPEPLQLYPDFRNEFFEIYSDADPVNYDFFKSSNHLKEISEKNNVKYLDLTPLIEQYNKQELDIEDCGSLFGDHFSPCGHKVLSEIVSQYILKEYINKD